MLDGSRNIFKDFFFPQQHNINILCGLRGELTALLKTCACPRKNHRKINFEKKKISRMPGDGDW